MSSKTIFNLNKDKYYKIYMPSFKTLVFKAVSTKESLYVPITKDFYIIYNNNVVMFDGNGGHVSVEDDFGCVFEYDIQAEDIAFKYAYSLYVLNSV